MEDNTIKKNWMQKVVDAVEGFFLNIFKKIGLKGFVEWYLKHQEGMRYLVFGALATVVNIVSYDICYYAFHISNGISNAIAWVAGAVFAYFTNGALAIIDKWIENDCKDDMYKILSIMRNVIGYKI